MLITPLFDTVIHYISITVIKVKAELQLFSIILKNVIKLPLITITILITPTLFAIYFLIRVLQEACNKLSFTGDLSLSEAFIQAGYSRVIATAADENSIIKVTLRKLAHAIHKDFFQL